MGWLRTLVVLACCLGVVGCSDDSPGPEPGPSPTGSVSTPSPSSSSSAPEPAPTEPALPGAAKEATERGARAFIAYYWDLINYAQVTGDVTALKRVSGPNCDGCNAGIEGIRKIYDDGARVRGGEHTVAIKEIKKLKSRSGNARAFEAVVTATHEGQTIIPSEGPDDVRGPGADIFDVYVLWVSNAWRLDVMEVQ